MNLVGGVVVEEKGQTMSDLPHRVSVKLLQLSVIGAAKVSHFEIMCRARGRIPTVGTFRHFYVNSISNGWLSFSKHRGADDPCCYSKKFDSLKNWNNHFFWIDASVSLISTSWFSGTSVVKDPLPVDEAMDLPCESWERTLVEKEVPLITETEDRAISLSLQTIGLVDHTIQDELNVNSGKSHTALRRLIRQCEQAAAGSGSVASATEYVTSSSVTPTLERALEDALHDNVRTRPPFGCFVVLSYGFVDTDIPATSQVVPLVSSSQAGVSMPVTESTGNGRPLSAPELETGTLSTTSSHGSSADDFYESQTVNFATAMNVYVPNWNVANNARRDAEAVELKAKLEKSDSEATEVEELPKRVSGLKAMVVVKVGEAASLTTQNAGLLEKDAAKRRFAERATALDARIAVVRRDMDKDLYPHMLTAIAGFEAGVAHGKAGRSLAQINAYDLEVEGKYVAAVSEFEGVSFPLLDELESLKDSSIALIMSVLILKDDQGNRNATSEFARFQPSLDQVVVPIYSESGFVDREMLLSDAIPAIRQSTKRKGLCLPSSSALGGTSGLAPSHDSSLGVTDYQVSTLVLSGDGGPTNPPLSV
uniref:Transposase (Putative), gypsy type n=1 Tax=Tanacetum cinerariifolium TaxID=118510 RepID=A0A699H3H2_TANCI|nr:transposase (putative), gypsy type [Tanacetum cinerariifolium]